MNRIPNPTMIFSTPYKIKYFKRLESDDSEDLCGQIDPVTGEIRLLESMCRSMKNKTWLHEVLHGIFKEINIKMTENELDTLANSLYDTFTRNKMDFSK